MRVIFSEDHKLRNARTELYGGELVPPFEAPFRAEWILAAVKEAGFTDVVAPARHGLETALKVHDGGYLKFLQTAWDRWKAAGYKGEAIATSFPVRRTWTTAALPGTGTSATFQARLHAFMPPASVRAEIPRARSSSVAIPAVLPTPQTVTTSASGESCT